MAKQITSLGYTVIKSRSYRPRCIVLTILTTALVTMVETMLDEFTVCSALYPTRVQVAPYTISHH